MGTVTAPTGGRGSTVVSDSAVAAVVAAAADSVPGTVGRSSGLGRLTGRHYPRVDVQGDLPGGGCAIDTEIAVEWPAPVAPVARAVREAIRGHVRRMVGVEAHRVNVRVAQIHAAEDGAPVRRVTAAELRALPLEPEVAEPSFPEPEPRTPTVREPAALRAIRTDHRPVPFITPTHPIAREVTRPRPLDDVVVRGVDAPDAAPVRAVRADDRNGAATRPLMPVTVPDRPAPPRPEAPAPAPVASPGVRRSAVRVTPAARPLAPTMSPRARDLGVRATPSVTPAAPRITPTVRPAAAPIRATATPTPVTRPYVVPGSGLPRRGKDGDHR